MLAQYLTRSPVVVRRERASYPIRFSRRLVLGLTLATLAGCTSLPPAPLAGAHPADPAAPVRPTTYRSTVGPFETARPVDAGSWQDTNERIAPKVKP